MGIPVYRDFLTAYLISDGILVYGYTEIFQLPIPFLMVYGYTGILAYRDFLKLTIQFLRVYGYTGIQKLLFPYLNITYSNLT